MLNVQESSNYPDNNDPFFKEITGGKDYDERRIVFAVGAETEDDKSTHKAARPPTPEEVSFPHLIPIDHCQL